MALELFKPFIFHKLEKEGLVPQCKDRPRMARAGKAGSLGLSGRSGQRASDPPQPGTHPCTASASRLLNPYWWKGKAIQIHPLVCAAFNADFDGDQMAVHVPLSVEAQIEAKTLMLSTQNILSPANGRPLAIPSQDMVLGCYYLTLDRKDRKGEGRMFSSTDEVLLALGG